MASNHGQITEFSGNADDWEAYIEQLESYFVANDITTAAKKRAILLSSCGTVAYKTIRSVVAPTKPTEVEYKDLHGTESARTLHISSVSNCPTL